MPKNKAEKTPRKPSAPKRTRKSSGKRTAHSTLYRFGQSVTDGDGSMKSLLGGKGANLAEMTALGLPVPPGFTITTSACEQYYAEGGRLPKDLLKAVENTLVWLEKESGKRFGDKTDPLLLSVRSGAAVSMPGMMDTVLNLGLNDQSVLGLAELTQNERFAWDAYRRLINMFANVVMDVSHSHFEAAFAKVKKRHKAKADTDVPAAGMRELCTAYQAVYKKHVGSPFPQNPLRQLSLAVEAVFRSWNTNRAVRYRQINHITGLAGTAVNVQAMVFGNMGQDCGTGVAFTRDPSTGDNFFFGEFLVNAQGEDVVAGIRTPRPVSELPDWNPRIHAELLRIKKTLERHYRDMQDIEFTVERGKLFMLQTRTGKRAGPAAVKMACDMVKERLINRETALLRVPANDLTQLLLPSFDPQARQAATVLTQGLPASPGVAVGYPAFTSEEAVKRADAGEAVILVRQETSPDDVDGMHRAEGVLTSTGGMTSHAAVVARGWGKCCVAGAGDIRINADKGTVQMGGKTLNRKTLFSLNGRTGEVMYGAVATVAPTLSGDFKTLMGWADKARTLGVRTNADTPEDAARARKFGAQGIGLCRTEHMFFGGERIRAMQQMILAADDKSRAKALKKLLPFQRADFQGILKAMNGLPVTIRLLDPPLHEFLPREKAAQSDVAKALGIPLLDVQNRVVELSESNPMLGHRGCRLAVSYPAILQMQVRAIVEATIRCLKANVDARPEIMVPLVGMDSELAKLRADILATIAEVKEAKGYKGKLKIAVGTMIEVPRAALTAGQIAEHADFFSFGTNDLTQLTFGFSRDDINSFLPEYLRQEILTTDPFQSLDTEGVGRLVQTCVEAGRAKRPKIKLGLCGEHGGDPASVSFCHDVGLDYVSCSPFRVPVARLAAAQAAIRARSE